MRKLLVGAALLALAAAPLAARADTFILSNDNGGDGFVNIGATTFDLFGADNNVGGNTTSYLATAGANETLTFHWIYSTHDCCGSLFDPAGFILNGVKTQLSVDNNTAGVGSHGSFTKVLAAGDSYGFYVFSTDSILGRGDIAVGVPEPTAWSLMIMGFGGVGAILRNRRRPALAAA